VQQGATPRLQVVQSLTARCNSVRPLLLVLLRLTMAPDCLSGASTASTCTACAAGSYSSTAGSPVSDSTLQQRATVSGPLLLVLLRLTMAPGCLSGASTCTACAAGSYSSTAGSPVSDSTLQQRATVTASPVEADDGAWLFVRSVYLQELQHQQLPKHVFQRSL
jgi:hypothetical protein